MTQKKQVLYSLQVLFLLFNCQTPEPFGIYPGTKSSLDDLESGDVIAVPNDTTNEARALLLLQDNGILLSLTVVRRKNRCIHCVYLVAAIFAVVLKYSNLFLPFTFFLYCFHFALCYKLIVCPKTTAFMKSIRNLFTFIQRDKSLFLYFGKIHCL